VKYEGVSAGLAIERPAAGVVVSNDWALRRFADLGEIMRIYTDAPAFDAALRAASAR
jgi:hypothetical protein